VDATPDALPPGPKLPRALQTFAFLFGGTRWLQACRRRYGDVVMFSTLFDPGFVMVFDPEDVERVFKAPPDQLRAGESNAPLSAILGERSVLVLDGADHIRHRKLMLPPFHGQRLRAHEEMMREAADRAIDSWPVGRELSLLGEMYRLTLSVVSRVVFGVDDDDRRAEIERRVRAVLDPMGVSLRDMLTFLRGRAPLDDDAMREMAGRRMAMDQAIFAEIAKRRAAGDAAERDDALSLLLTARDEDGHPLTDGEVRDEVVTLLVAGHETTAAGMAWTLDLLLRDRDRLARARAAAESGDTAYLDAVVKESLRVRPVVPGFGRKVRGKPFELGGYTIQPGTEINPSIRVVHGRADRYPSPKEFRPERFLDADAPDTYTWIPFGGGTRRCLGASFALLEMRVIVTQVLLRTELKPVGRRERIQRRGVTMVPKRGARAVQTRPPSPAPREQPDREPIAA
jgi:cytochrome P450